VQVGGNGTPATAMGEICASVFDSRKLAPSGMLPGAAAMATQVLGATLMDILLADYTGGTTDSIGGSNMPGRPVTISWVMRLASIAAAVTEGAIASTTVSTA